MDVLCGGAGTGLLSRMGAKLMADANAIDCTGDVCGGANLAADKALCCYADKSRFDQRTDAVLVTASVVGGATAASYTDPGTQSITALHGALSNRPIAQGGRAHTSTLVAECDVMGGFAPLTDVATVATCVDPGHVCADATGTCPAGCTGGTAPCSGTATCALAGGALIADCDTADGCAYQGTDVPLQGGSATHWTQMQAAKERIGATACP